MSVIFFFSRSSHSLIFHNSKRQKKKTPFVQARQCIYCGPYTFRQANIAHLHRLLLGLVGIARPWVKRSSQRAWAAELSPRNYGLQAPAHTHVGRERIGNFSVRTHAYHSQQHPRAAVRAYVASQPTKTTFAPPRSAKAAAAACRRHNRARASGASSADQRLPLSLSLSFFLSFLSASSSRTDRSTLGTSAARRPGAGVSIL